MSTVETIAAISTAPGRAGIGVVRISGPGALEIAKTITGKTPEPGHHLFTSFKDADGNLIDRGLVLFFRAPHSYTGEDVVELHAHGNDVVLRQLLDEIYSNGARPARAGEFTERAFLNDKIDLVQAEAVMDLIESMTSKAARSAMRSLEGVFSKQVTDIQEKLVSAKALLEAALDFPDEEDIEVDIQPVKDNILSALELTRKLTSSAEAGATLNKGLNVVIAGKPNVGKSSLLNYLAGNEVAIVSDIPGTTRDRVQQSILLDGMELLLVDTAGIRDSDDKIEAQGILRARESMEKADLVISVFEDDADYTGLDEYLPAGVHVIRVRNKIDINQPNEQFIPEGVIPVSVTDELGMDDLIRAIRSILNLDSSEENSVSARQRHVKALQSASLNIEQALEGINNNAGYEVIGEQIRQALLSFDQVLGRVTADDILGVIFSRFCIGK